MRASSKRPRVETFGVAPPPPSSAGATSTKASVDPIAATIPPPSTSNDSNIRCMLETVMTVQMAYGQILVDMLDELHALLANLEHLR